MRLDYRDAAQRLLWLSRGREPAGIRETEWAGTLEVARRERLLALAWHNGGAAIRRLAPPAISAQWRAEVLRDMDRGEAQREALGRVIESLTAAGIDVIVLKGAPLAQRLYGDPALRPSLDVDLYVPAAQRGAARSRLEALGWVRMAGDAPWEESFHLASGAHQLLIEVHSALLDDPVLAHLRLPPPEPTEVQLGALAVPAQGGDLLPACLATHLAKHDHAPLLWLNDFSLLWGGLGAEGQQRSRAAARRTRMNRYLEWAVERAARLEDAVAGDPAALWRLGYHPEGRRETHGLVRLARLAARPADAAAVLAGRAWPPHLRGDGRGFVRQALDRLRGRVARARARATAPATELPDALQSSSLEADRPAARTLDVDRAEFGLLLGDLMQAGIGTWIRARGESMEPTIPNGAMVHVVPLPSRELRRGDIVLARMPNGTFAIHRVLGESGGRVAMQGDSIPRPDPEIPRAAVLGLADGIEVRGRLRPVPPAPTWARRHASALVRRVLRRLPWLAGGRRRPPAMARAGGR